MKGCQAYSENPFAFFALTSSYTLTPIKFK